MTVKRFTGHHRGWINAIKWEKIKGIFFLPRQNVTRFGLRLSIISGYAAIRHAPIAPFGSSKSSCCLSVTDIVDNSGLGLHSGQWTRASLDLTQMIKSIVLSIQ